MMRDIRPIKTEADYDWALAEIAGYFESQSLPDSEEGQRFDVLADLIEAYEARVHPIGLPDPVEAVRVRLEERGMSQADLSRLLGARSMRTEAATNPTPHGAAADAEHGDALRLARPLTWADQQALHPHRHVAEQ